MSFAELHFRASVSAPDKSAEVSHQPAAVLNCLVISPSEDRREQLLKSAIDAGWDTIVCSHAASALTACERTGFQMAIVDLCGYDGRPAKLHDLCQELTTTKRALLVVCGHENNPDEEIWARQLGAWLYLPGAVSGNDIAEFCRQARQIVDDVVVLD